MSTEMVGMQKRFQREVMRMPKNRNWKRFLSSASFTVDLKRGGTFKDERHQAAWEVYQTLDSAAGERPGESLAERTCGASCGPEGTHVNYDANVNTTVHKLRLALGGFTGQADLCGRRFRRQGYSFRGAVSARRRTRLLRNGNGNAQKLRRATDSAGAGRGL